ncbi:MAG: hypothetical protein GX682_03240 [Clostridiaceae bacterium]|nr:hypothetical protein [Clostridiaceae bacterium]
MDKAIMRLAYVILGFGTGLVAGIIYAKKVPTNSTFSIIALVVIGIIIALIVESNIEHDKDKLIIFMILCVLTPIVAIIGQYLYAIVVVLFSMIIGILKFIF